MMDSKEARRVAVIEQTLEGKFPNQRAIEMLELSVRMVSRLTWLRVPEIRSPVPSSNMIAEELTIKC